MISSRIHAHHPHLPFRSVLEPRPDVCYYKVVRLLKTRDTASRAVFTNKVVPPLVVASWLPLVEEFDFSSDGKN